MDDQDSDTEMFAPNLFTRQIECVSLDGASGSFPELLKERNTPLLISGLAADWPALHSWNAGSLSARFGSKPVRVYNALFGEPGKNYMDSIGVMPFSEFLSETLGKGRDLRMFLYNIGRQIPELLEDVEFPDVGLNFAQSFVYSFFGCRGSITPLHYDIDMSHVLYTSILGRRRIRLFAPDQSTALHKHPFTVRSYVNLDDPNDVNYPALKAARGYEVVVEAGQSLFIPSAFWHEVKYLDAGIGISLRAANQTLNGRLMGLMNILALSPVDRISNKLAAEHWFGWKQGKADARGRAFMNNRRVI
ncbi:MAG: cupin-like domain-containing protein [Pseudomonadales bacterium]|nr:cupin-like domain-containing protein [Pseudomonadales bacterium]